MGYSYDARTGQLCCDACGRHGGVRRKRCPVNWCQPIALCAACRPTHTGDAWKQQHLRCPEFSARFHAEEEARLAARRRGQPVIDAGVGLPNGHVFAWTSTGNYEVTTETYHAGLAHPAHVLDTKGAKRRRDERPAEVYG